MGIGLAESTRPAQGFQRVLRYVEAVCASPGVMLRLSSVAAMALTEPAQQPK